MFRAVPGRAARMLVKFFRCLVFCRMQSRFGGRWSLLRAREQSSISDCVLFGCLQNARFPAWLRRSAVRCLGCDQLRTCISVAYVYCSVADAHNLRER